MHTHKELKTTARLLISLILNLVITAVEIIGGIISGSLALISDALHNFTDALAIVVSYAAMKISGRKKDFKKTFGYKRAEVIAAVINSSVLIAVLIFLLKEAFIKFLNPAPVKGGIVFIVAAVGFAANISGVLLLKKPSLKSSNIKSTYTHLLADSISSVAVILSGILIYFLNIYWIDPLITILISLYIFKEVYFILKKSINIIMQSAPPDINLIKIKEEIEKIKEVKDIHHTHIWQLSDADIFLETHITVDDMPVSKTSALTSEIEKILYDKFKITHITIQYETKRACAEN